MSLTDRLDNYLDAESLSAVWFARPDNVAWLTGGDTVVDESADIGVAAAGYDGDGITVVTDSIEAPRLRAEELDDTVAVEPFAWHETTLPAAVAAASPAPAAADFDVPGFESLDATPLRQPLTATQIERYRELGTTVAQAVETVARSVRADDTEQAVAAELRGALAARNIKAPVVLVGGAERAQQFRHYTPKAEPLSRYALLSVTARRGGQYLSCTRTVAFDVPPWLRERTRAAMRVEATALAASRSVGQDGGTAGDIFADIQSAYDAVGWDGEWRNHHQGGATGFAGREWIATPESDATVTLPQAYAWNPTVEGAKSEDTHLVTTEGIEVLSGTGQWPTEHVEAVGYDETVMRHGVLEK